MATAPARGQTAEDAARDKNKRYDRQLRLWGEHGQQALEGARIALLGATASGCETLKNLVLPGVGHYTVVDSAVVSARDLGNNFFVSHDSVGQPRARVACALLGELNDLVHGEAVERDPCALLDTEPDFFLRFTHIVAADLPLSAAHKLDAICMQHSIPLFFVRVNGFLGTLRLVSRQHHVLEPKSANVKWDLRLQRPWRELEEYCLARDCNPDTVSSEAYSHIPWIVWVVREAHKWRAEHDGRVPSTRDEQAEFRARLKKHDYSGECENVAEAVTYAHYVWMPLAQTSDTARAFAAADAEVDSKSAPFWFVVRALRDFVHNEGHGLTPLTGELPDMHADSKSYLELQHLFARRAEADLAVVRGHVASLLAKAGLPATYVPDERIRTACKNATQLLTISYRTLQEEWSAPNTEALSSAAMMGEMDGECLPFYVTQRAADVFHMRYGRLPGDCSSPADDVAHLLAFAEAEAAKCGIEAGTFELRKYSEEMIRWGGAVLHPIAAFMGGVTAQEVIKVLTGQLVPINNTVVFNGLLSTTASYEA